MDGIGFVNEAGAVLEGEEAVGEADRDVDDVPVGGREFEAGGLAVGGR